MFLATYVRDPEPEYSEETYGYNPELALRPIYRYRIPHSLEIDKLKDRIKQLEHELATQKNERQ